ncbi:hypothetical protein GOP47_0014271 [Adiantum capillus-veneris]|uniref:Alpha N-terminal protein methyltransferase 1 n=1 Tax=Adiantum capillus-veneris TaxID=13818 RepID=A0A9D4UL52_ADICA|nr:hypothetical protein GOP47_0014271 [Adiantum capillus-veneris]
MRELLLSTEQLLISAAAQHPFFFSPRRSGSCAQVSLSVCSSLEMEEKGVDSDGNPFTTRSQLWAKEAGEDIATSTCFDPTKKQEWYSKGVSYWEGVEASVNGVLGGYGHVNDRDVAASDGFILEILPEATRLSKHLVALDCGAGVGRVTKNLLLRHFHEVDLVEPVSHFLEAAKDSLMTVSPSSSVFGRAINFYCKPLQEFIPKANRYDMIWVQWCIGHLTDRDLVEFFKRAKVGLRPYGFFVVKENTTKHGFLVDKDDNSITRSDAYYRDLFEQAGLFLLKTKMQKGFPKELFPVRMYALTTEPVKAGPIAHRTREFRSCGQGLLLCMSHTTNFEYEKETVCWWLFARVTLSDKGSFYLFTVGTSFAMVLLRRIYCYE